jgi:septum formation protein
LTKNKLPDENKPVKHFMTNKSSIKIILASRSPRRRQLLTEAGYKFEVSPPSDIDESPLPGGETPAELVARLACNKAANVAGQIEQGLWQSASRTASPHHIGGEVINQTIILGCDTVVECDGRILGKPADEDDARRMLEALSGHEHQVLTEVCLRPIPEGQSLVRVAVTTLRMDKLSNEAIENYLAGGQWEGKAGAFGYQDRLGWIHVVDGSRSNAVGLPLELLAEMLETARD